MWRNGEAKLMGGEGMLARVKVKAEKGIISTE
jgi:hypothetical protein